MPRKRKLRPMVELHIEGLSTGKVLRKQEYDDFTGKPLAMPVDTSTDVPLLGADVIRAAQQRQSDINKRKLWTMLKPDKVPMVGQTKIEPTHTEVKLGDHIALIPLPPKKPFRRF